MISFDNLSAIFIALNGDTHSRTKPIHMELVYANCVLDVAFVVVPDPGFDVAEITALRRNADTFTEAGSHPGRGV